MATLDSAMSGALKAVTVLLLALVVSAIVIKRQFIGA